MKKTFKLLWIISAIAEIVLGIYVIFNPTKTLVSLSLILGLVTIFNGACQIIYYVYEDRQILKSTSVLVDGILSVAIGIVFIATKAFVALGDIIPYIIAIIMIIKGISMMSYGNDLRKLHVTSLVLVFGIVLTILGVVAIFFPQMMAFIIALVFGCILIVDGIDNITLFNATNKIENNIKKIGNISNGDVIDVTYSNEKEETL